MSLRQLAASTASVGRVCASGRLASGVARLPGAQAAVVEQVAIDVPFEQNQIEEERESVVLDVWVRERAAGSLCKGETRTQISMVLRTSRRFGYEALTG